ncbi:universal stress protein [Cytophagales bacterium LB-30]|uniref:Universal stress protein n=1 Tax=Shiella aurantiaca TaxID=3058365 RepID=A0ABT8F2J2_9BACT|nr:universal stress protein [Shiella aurantiaca]MDN4164456.1 universal stress protein [Shiella aurantiaca]
MKTLLVPTDFSANSYNACKLARTLAGSTGAEIHLLHVVYTPADWELMTDEMKSHYPESQKKVSDAEAKLKELSQDVLFTGVDIKSSLAYGAPIDSINRYLSKQEVDLVVVGSHGSASKADLFIGSNTQKVMRNTHVPVIAVKGNYELPEVNKILFASNFGADAHAPFQRIRKIAQALSAELELLYVNTPHEFKNSEDIEAILDAFIDANKAKGEVKVSVRNNKDVAQGILTHCQNIKADMAALVTHRKASSAHYLMGVTEHLVFKAPFPVISINVS